MPTAPEKLTGEEVGLHQEESWQMPGPLATTVGWGPRTPTKEQEGPAGIGRGGGCTRSPTDTPQLWSLTRCLIRRWEEPVGHRQGEAVTRITRTASDLREIKTGALVGPLLLRWGAPWRVVPKPTVGSSENARLGP